MSPSLDAPRASSRCARWDFNPQPPRIITPGALSFGATCACVDPTIPSFRPARHVSDRHDHDAAAARHEIRMDEQLRKLERTARAFPDDELAARSYETALRRADRRFAIEARLRSKLACSSRWIHAIGSDDFLHCWRCDRPVVRTRSVEVAVRCVEAGTCAQIERPLTREVVAMLAERGEVHGARAPGSPCLVVRNAQDGPVRWSRFLYKASWGSEKAPFMLYDLEKELMAAADPERIEVAFSSPLPDPPPVRGAARRSHADYDCLFRRGSVDPLELMRDALVHCRDHWSMDEYCRLARRVDEDWENYNSLDAVAAMVLLATAFDAITSCAP